jgi:hypothetical protein
MDIQLKGVSAAKVVDLATVISHEHEHWVLPLLPARR